MAQFPQTTYGVRLERYTKQRDEWTRSLQMHVTPAAEQVMRKLFRAAEICVHMQPRFISLDDAYNRLLARSRSWTDEELRTELGERRADDAEICLQMVVKSHATVLALATARHCRQIIPVPSITKFFRLVMEACAAELSQSDLFCTADIDIRSKVRRWIDDIVRTRALALVPVNIFAKSSAEEPKPVPFKIINAAVQNAENLTDEEEEPMTSVAPPVPLPTTVEVPAAPAADVVPLTTNVSLPLPPPAEISPSVGKPTESEIATEADSMRSDVAEEETLSIPVPPVSHKKKEETKEEKKEKKHKEEEEEKELSSDDEEI